MYITRNDHNDNARRRNDDNMTNIQRNNMIDDMITMIDIELNENNNINDALIIENVSNTMFANDNNDTSNEYNDMLLSCM